MSYIIKNFKKNSNFEMSKSWDMLGENQNIFTCKQKFLGEHKVSLDFYI